MIPRPVLIGPVLRYRVLPVTRMISTRSSLGAKHFLKKDLRSSNKNHIIEEPKPYKDPKIQLIYNEIATYLSADADKMPNNIKSKILQRKMISLLSLDGVQEKSEVMEVLELVVNNGLKKQIPLEISILVFSKYFNEIIESGSTFANSVVKSLLSNIDKLPTATVIQLIDYTQDKNVADLSVILKSLQTKVQYNDFIEEYLFHLKETGKFNLKTFEELIMLNEIHDSLITYLDEYIQLLFEDNIPEVHCYTNLEYNLDRIQMLLNNLIEKVDFKDIAVESVIKLFKLNWEILSANRCEASARNGDKILNYVQDKVEPVKSFIFRQNLDDESLLEIILFSGWSYPSKALAKEVSNFVIADDVKFSPYVRFQSEIYCLAHSNLPEQELLGQIINKTPQNLDTDLVCEKVIQALMTSDIPPTASILDKIISGLAVEQSVYSYKYRIDKAISNNDHESALKLYNRSISNVTQWSEYTHDPSIVLTLNNLIQCLVNNLPMKEAFPLFQNVKAQLQKEINIDTINAIVPKILQEDMTGDIIELMNRELPKIPKDSPIKLPMEQPFGYKYYQLFDTIHEYCITNTKDKRMVNNWYLYTHCYNYFFIPHDRILPTMKFFCENERWNGALRIFKKVIEMSQLHGEHKHKPPTREMYLYLINEFGDKLYEDGVIEVHELLKMDLNLAKQDKELQHSIMNAYCNLQEVGKVRDLFLSMSLEPKESGGVDETSATIMIKAYTYNDLIYVKKFWDNLSMFGLVPDYQMFKQYLIAYSYHGCIEKSIEIADSIQDYELELTSDLLTSMHNFCYQIEGQEKLKTWAQSNHPEIWQQAVESGKLIDASGYKPNENFLVAGSSSDPKHISEPIFK
ncbi:conserved hypothetical protein [Candida dubliniensis CD36]|uniref:Mitochondrial group I intron splicing factor CCM1 n=1 Tax=Candida dubliniensis (strain CD36 / ATCC MYA-646 / CBS 7987 / NCPF 3949 / NRRL Y-17841) TaxID=573826 RepID=B9WCK5_CANDC|nr:conserved hypothetical protein [Candida dubliniensis CD36]CAX44128.1 conserved hypothetical protein [Candida dubliniensis CD36]